MAEVAKEISYLEVISYNDQRLSFEDGKLIQ